MKVRARRPGAIAAVAVVAVAMLLEIAGYVVYGQSPDAIRVLVGALVLLVAGCLVAVLLRFRQRGTRERLVHVEHDRADLESLYERVLRLARDIFVLEDVAGTVIDANAAAEEAYGYTRDEMLRLNVSDLRAPGSAAALEDERDAASHLDGALVEAIHIRKDGSTFPVEASFQAIDVGGVPLRQSFTRDISRRRTAESDLRRLNAAYATLAATNDAIVRATDDRDLFARTCRIAVEQGGYLGAWVGVASEPSGQIVPVASAGSIDAYIRQLVITPAPATADAGRPAAVASRSGRPSYSDDFLDDPAMAPWAVQAGSIGVRAAVALPLSRGSGPAGVLSLYSAEPHVFDTRMRALLETMAANLSFALVGLDRDSARKVAEAELRDSEARYRTLAESSPLAVFVNREDRVVLANPACVRLFGASSPLDLLGRRALELFAPDSRELVRERIRVDSEEVPLVEVRIVRLDGRVVDVEATASPFVDQGVKAIQVLLSDITERRQAHAEIQGLAASLEQRVVDRTAELEAANRELESLSYSVSHDLRAPLRAVSGFASILSRRYRADLDEKGRHYVDTIVESGVRMSALIDELLAYSRLGRRSIRAEPVPLGPIVAGLRATFGERFEATGATFEVVEPLATPVGDSILLERILLNLVDNALTYRRDGVVPHITLSAIRRDGVVTLAVADNGIGIPAEYRERVFEVFARLHTDEEYPGTGIGLSVVRKAARLMSSDITVESVEGMGSTFGIELPAAQQRRTAA